MIIDIFFEPGSYVIYKSGHALLLIPWVPWLPTDVHQAEGVML
jgi:hypothetical protein